ncbi:MAG: hypothetical protein Q4C81_02570 [Kocuria sp.]|nr:hypothetical protein [Kocuria sp.]
MTSVNATGCVIFMEIRVLPVKLSPGVLSDTCKVRGAFSYALSGPAGWVHGNRTVVLIVTALPWGDPSVALSNMPPFLAQ